MSSRITNNAILSVNHPIDRPLPPPRAVNSALAREPAGRGSRHLDDPRRARPVDRGAPGEPVCCNTTAFLTCNHTGTHMDAPAHFYNGVPTIEQVPLEQFIGPAALVDVRQIRPRGEITPADFAQHEDSHQGHRQGRLLDRLVKPLGPATIISMTTRS